MTNEIKMISAKNQNLNQENKDTRIKGLERENRKKNIVIFRSTE